MEARAVLALALLGMCALAHSSPARLLLVDSKHNAYLAARGPAKISKPAMQGVVSALTGLQPVEDIDEGLSQQIGEVVKPSPLQKPKAHVCLHMAGMNEDDLATVFNGRQSIPAELEADGHVADFALDMLATMASNNPEVAVVSLDDVAVQGCNGDDCLRQVMSSAAQAIGASATDSSVMLDGGVQLNLDQLNDRLFANELASLFAGVNSVGQNPAEDIQVLEMTMLGLQGLADSYGADASQVAAGKAAATQMLQWAVQQLDAVFGGDVTFQVATFDSAPASGVEDALAWKELARSRRLQQATATAPEAAEYTAFPGPNEAQQAKIFSAKAAGYGGFILLLYFLLGGVYCLCNMPFKRDTLLYGSKKDQ